MSKNTEKNGKMTIKLDAKDKKILAELFDDARIHASSIAKKVRLSKEVVNYRIKRLISSRLLVGFNTVIDVKKIGWEMFFIYIRFRNIDVEKEKEILEFLKAHHSVAQLFKCIGNYDTIMKVFVRQYEEIDDIMKNIESKYKENIEAYFIDYIIEESAVPFSFMYPTKTQKLYYMKGDQKQRVELQKLDLKILKAISKNARISLTELSLQLKTSRDNIKYHLKKLESKKIILKYRPDILTKTIDYNWHFLILKVGKLSIEIKNKLEAYLLTQENITYFYKTIGASDLQVELRIKTTGELNVILMEIRSILKTVLKRHEMLIILDELKYTYFPECLDK